MRSGIPIDHYTPKEVFTVSVPDLSTPSPSTKRERPENAEQGCTKRNRGWNNQNTMQKKCAPNHGRCSAWMSLLNGVASLLTSALKRAAQEQELNRKCKPVKENNQTTPKNRKQRTAKPKRDSESCRIKGYQCWGCYPASASGSPRLATAGKDPDLLGFVQNEAPLK